MNRANASTHRAALLGSVVAAATLITLSGCGPTASKGFHSSTGSASTGSTNSDVPRTPGPNGVTAVALPPLPLYPSADPCASLSGTEPALSAPGPCQQQWQVLHNATIPGQDAMGTVAIHQAGYGPGMDSATAGEWIAAYLRTQAFQRWAEAHGDVIVDSQLDPPGHAGGPVESAMSYGARISEPPCSAPSAVVAVLLDANEVATLRGQGWSHPSSTALLVTFPPCSGIVITYPNGLVETLYITKQPVTRVVSGGVQTVSPFGRVWITDGDVPCSVAGLGGVCKSAGAG